MTLSHVSKQFSLGIPLKVFLLCQGYRTGNQVANNNMLYIQSLLCYCTLGVTLVTKVDNNNLFLSFFFVITVLATD
jgi:hypothetical protein